MLTLKTTTDFQRVRREGQSWSHPLVVLSACPNDQNETRIGITASKSVGGAVARNRAKRRLREAMRRKEKESGISGGWDFILIARPPLVKAEWRKVIDALNGLMQKWQIAVSK